MGYDVTIQNADTGDELFWRNHTSNCSNMWRAAGCDLAEFSGKTTDELLPALSRAIAAMKADPARYQVMSPPNGWGSYESCVNFLDEVLEGCRAFKSAKVCVSW